jgi:hypothetical protein
MKSTLKATETTHLKLTIDKLLINFAFKFNLRRYIKATRSALAAELNSRAKGSLGRAVQVHPMNPELKQPATSTSN